MSRSLNLKEVEPRLATRMSIFVGATLPSPIARSTQGDASVAPTELEGRLTRRCTEAGHQFRMRARDHMRGDEFADATGGFRAGVDRGLHRADIATNDRGH